MPRIAPVVAANTPAAAAPLLAAVQRKLGFTPNMMATMAQAPTVLRGYLGLAEALGAGSVTAREAELIALAVGQANDCAYCLAAHATIGRGAGLDDAEIAAARAAQARDPREAALVGLAAELVRRRGRLDDAALDEARRRGLADAVILEVVGHVALNVMTNYVNHVADTAVDFPPLARAA